MNESPGYGTKGCRYSVVQYVVLKVCIKKIKIVLAKMEKVLYTIPVSAVDIPR